MTITSCGDVGDSCVTLGLMAQIHGGPHKFLFYPSPITKMKTMQDVSRWLNFVKPLFEIQPYVEEIRSKLPTDHVDWDSGGFRSAGLHSSSSSLFEAQLSHLVLSKGFGRSITPLLKWLHVDPSPESKGRIICARSARYHNDSFPWKQIVQHYGDLLLFIGLHHEYLEFCGEFGIVEYRQTQNALEIAQLIAGSELFIGNQSSPMTIAEGLKHPTIQETSTNPTDCVYYRENAQWVDNGDVILPAIGGRESIHLRPKGFSLGDILIHTTPPGQWQVETKPDSPPLKCGVFGDLVRICKLNKIGPENGQLEDWIKTQNAMRVPEFFFGEAIQQQTKNSEAARLNAGYGKRTMRQMIGLG